MTRFVNASPELLCQSFLEDIAFVEAEIRKELVDERELWSADVKTRGGDLPEGLFKSSAENIASTLLKRGKARAMRRLNFYVNRAGSNLSSERRSVMNAAKSRISAS